MDSYNYKIYKLLKSAAEAPDAGAPAEAPAAPDVSLPDVSLPDEPGAASPEGSTPDVSLPDGPTPDTGENPGMIPYNDPTATSNLYTDPRSPKYGKDPTTDYLSRLGTSSSIQENPLNIPDMSSYLHPTTPTESLEAGPDAASTSTPGEFDNVNINMGTNPPAATGDGWAATGSPTNMSNPAPADNGIPTSNYYGVYVPPQSSDKPAGPDYSDPYYSTWSKERPDTGEGDTPTFDSEDSPGFMGEDEYNMELDRLGSMWERLNNDDRMKYMNEFDKRRRDLDEARWGKQPEYQPTPSVTSNPLDEYDATSPFVQHKKERDAYAAGTDSPDTTGAPGYNKEVGELPDVGNTSPESADVPVYPEYQEKLDAIDNNPSLTSYEKYQYRQQVIDANKEEYMNDPNRPLMPDELFRYKETHHSATGEPSVYTRHFTPGEKFDEEYKPPESYKDPYGDYDFGNYSSMEQAISDLSDKLNAGEITQDEYNNQLSEIYSRQEIAEYGGAFTGTDKPKTVAGRPYYKGEPMTRGQIAAYNHMGLGTLKNILEMKQHGRDLRDAGRAVGEEDAEGYSLGPNGAINYRLEY